jgi:hypothetical protein
MAPGLLVGWFETIRESSAGGATLMDSPEPLPGETVDESPSSELPQARLRSIIAANVFLVVRRLRLRAAKLEWAAGKAEEMRCFMIVTGCTGWPSLPAFVLAVFTQGNVGVA